ncbi:MAG: hypothetical protein AB7G13_14450 [Lautropia sp.]
MLILLRVIAIAIGLVAIGYAVAYLRTGERRYLSIARRTFVGGIVTALVFFAVMFAQRLIE